MLLLVKVKTGIISTHFLTVHSDVMIFAIIDLGSPRPSRSKYRCLKCITVLGPKEHKKFHFLRNSQKHAKNIDVNSSTLFSNFSLYIISSKTFHAKMSITLVSASAVLCDKNIKYRYTLANYVKSSKPTLWNVDACWSGARLHDTILKNLVP
jgi:hypothetical protein